MRALQKALNHDQMNAEAMHLLGELYLEEGEGNEAAMALCAKSVELEPDNLAFLLGYARCLVALGEAAEAEPLVQRCLRSSLLRPKAYLVKADLQMARGDVEMGLQWYRKLLASGVANKRLAKAAEEGVTSCQSILAGFGGNKNAAN
jgi:cytochrome c-type biogenesis protein CcmH/NrfG